MTKSKPVACFGPDNRCAFGNSFDTLAVLYGSEQVSPSTRERLRPGSQRDESRKVAEVPQPGPSAWLRPRAGRRQGRRRFENSLVKETKKDTTQVALTKCSLLALFSCSVPVSINF